MPTRSGTVGTPTGKAAKATQASPTNRAVDLRFAPRRLVVVLDDGREVSVPLDFYPSLAGATRTQRAAWEVIGDGQGFHWPSLDLDLSVEGLLRGMREAIPAPPPRRRKVAG